MGDRSQAGGSSDDGRNGERREARRVGDGGDGEGRGEDGEGTVRHRTALVCKAEAEHEPVERRKQSTALLRELQNPSDRLGGWTGLRQQREVYYTASTSGSREVSS